LEEALALKVWGIIIRITYSNDFWLDKLFWILLTRLSVCLQVCNF